ncbi:hypothetical protein GJ744_012197 [Endocarpon pusillum]|uniref:DUF7924 domain-containing protein n=1 Tax=Endocarpon pusillum TaxID=364733 RepID=A0A8H7ABK6_9EURO|nr:hypothetical protein GJ744_012197 [Endocarpon pusillum]
MATGVAKRETGSSRRGHNKPDQLLVRPHQSSRKRRRSTKDDDEDEETTAHRRKSPRIQEILNEQHQEHLQRVKSKPSRRSPRLQEIQDVNGQRTARGRQMRSSPKPIKTQQYSRQRQAVEQYHSPKEKDEGQPTVSLTNLGAQKSTKRRRRVNDRDELNHDAKRPRHRLAQRTESRTAPDKENFIENWLDESCRSRRASTENETRLPGVSTNMPRKPAPVLPSPANSSESTISTSRKSEKSAASVHDTDYRQSLRYRNIYIERGNPPAELMRRAHRIISRSRISPEMDDAAIEELKQISRRLQDEAEDKIIKQLVPDIIPSMKKIPNQRLEMNSDQPWFNSVPVPLDASILTNPLPLPKPKPDLVFGYSEAAFTRNQLGTIDLLVDDQFGRSYAVPDQKIRFPFLDIEFKSQAKNGTHYIATNQAAGAGTIALNGNMELIQRSFGMGKFDYDEPQYFSVTMDHELARINVHWLKAPGEGGGQYSFHVEGLSKHLLDDANGIRAVTRAIKNILDHGADTRLRTLCSALDAYRETVIRNREAGNAQRMQGHEVPSQPQTNQQARRRAPPPDPRVEGGASYEKEDRISRPSDEPVEHLQTERRPGSDAAIEEVETPKRTRRHAPQEAAAKNTKPGAVNRPNKRVASLESEQGSPSSIARTRQTRSSTKPPPAEVVATRAVWKQQPGWTFELDEQRVFLPDTKWHRGIRNRRAAWTNCELNVWCYDS